MVPSPADAVCTIVPKKEQRREKCTPCNESTSKSQGESNQGWHSKLVEQHGKFFQDPNFGGRRGKYGTIQDFDTGITKIVGKMSNRPLLQMYAEHCIMEGCDTEFQAPNATSSTTPKKEWHFVVGDGMQQDKGVVDVDNAEPMRDGISMDRNRNAKSLKMLVEHCVYRDAALLIEELIALRLYTGPLYCCYNTLLRGEDGTSGEEGTSSKYGTTINLVVSGLIKLGLPLQDTVFRGMGNMALGEAFFKKVSFIDLSVCLSLCLILTCMRVTLFVC